MNPLNCAVCGKDILLSDSAIVIFKEVPNLDGSSKRHVVDMDWVCQKGCDQKIRAGFQGKTSWWRFVPDLRIPEVFLGFIISEIMFDLQRGALVFDEAAYNKLRTFLATMSQTVFRPTNASEQARIQELKYISL